MAHRLARSKCKPQVGQRFSCDGVKYELRGKLGDGAAGIVRKAADLERGTLLAVKFLAPDPKYIEERAFDDVAQRFRREGQRGTKLRHEHLLEILGYCDNENGSAFKAGRPKNPFLLMQYVKGQTLEDYIRADNGPRGEFHINRPRVGIAIQIAHALEHLRDHRLVHRDVKPANVFLTKSKGALGWLAKLGDFGVMKWGDFYASFATGTLTVTSQKGLGTLKYISPEQALRPKEVTSRSDIWSFGITLFELFTGQILTSAHHVYEIANARRSRGNTSSRFLSMECGLPHENEGLAELVLDMFLAPDGRPRIDKIRGRLEWEYERRFGSEWGYDLQ
ncbi:MAG: serine/threonine protein kinase [Desulfobacteraceae bacterium]|nr:serine/threonine protein kinase [Desulfobacteraceae bacterium]